MLTVQTYYQKYCDKTKQKLCIIQYLVLSVLTVFFCTVYTVSMELSCDWKKVNTGMTDDGR